MDLQPTRQFDYLQRALSIFISNPSDMSEQFESLIDELIKENQQITKSPKINSPESSSSDSKSDLPMKCTSPQPLLVNLFFHSDLLDIFVSCVYRKNDPQHRLPMQNLLLRNALNLERQ